MDRKHNGGGYSRSDGSSYEVSHIERSNQDIEKQVSLANANDRSQTQPDNGEYVVTAKTWAVVIVCIFEFLCHKLQLT